MGRMVILLYTLTLTLCRSVNNGLGEERQELVDGASLIEREARDVRRGAEDCAG